MFEHITEYYDHILRSRICGDHEEAWIHFNFLSPSQKDDFFKYVGEEGDDTSEFINLKQYFNYANNVQIQG